MACERKNRYRHNTIAFWLTDEEKKIVEARIKTSGLKRESIIEMLFSA